MPGCYAACWPVTRTRRPAVVTVTRKGSRRVWLLYLPLVIPALAGAAARLVAARLEPRQETWLLTCGAVALAGCSTAALALLAAFAAARTPALAALGDYSQHVMQRADPI